MAETTTSIYYAGRAGEKNDNENIHLHYTPASPSSCLRSSMLSNTHRQSRSMRDSFCNLIHFYYSKAFSVFHLCSISSENPSHSSLFIATFASHKTCCILSLVLLYAYPPPPARITPIVAQKICSAHPYRCYQFLTLKRATELAPLLRPYGLRVVWTFFFQFPPAIEFHRQSFVSLSFDRGCMYV